MTPDKALEIIKQFQDWRVDKRDDCNYSPKELTKAIDTVIRVMEQLPRIPTDLLIHNWTDEELNNYHANVYEMLKDDTTTPPTT